MIKCHGGSHNDIKRLFLAKHGNFDDIVTQLYHFWFYAFYFATNDYDEFFGRHIIRQLYSFGCLFQCSYGKSLILQFVN